MSENINLQENIPQGENNIGKLPFNPEQALNASIGNCSLLNDSFADRLRDFKNFVIGNITKLNQDVLKVHSDDVISANKINEVVTLIVSKLEEVIETQNNHINETIEKFKKTYEDVTNFVIAPVEARFKDVEKEVISLKAKLSDLGAKVNSQVPQGSIFGTNNIPQNNNNSFAPQQNINNNFTPQQTNNNFTPQRNVNNPFMPQQFNDYGFGYNGVINDSIAVIDDMLGVEQLDQSKNLRLYVLRLGEDKALRFNPLADKYTPLILGEYKFVFKKMIHPIEGHIVYEAVDGVPHCSMQEYVKSLVRESLTHGKKSNKHSLFKSHDYVYKIKYNAKQIQMIRVTNRGENIKSGFYFGKSPDVDKFICQDANYWNKKSKKNKNKSKNKNKNNGSYNNKRFYNENRGYNNYYNNNGFRNGFVPNYQRPNNSQSFPFGKLKGLIRDVIREEDYGSQRGKGNFRRRN